MNENEIIRLTNEVFEEEFEVPAEQLIPEAHIFTDLGLDSLDVVDLIVALQKKFGVKVRNDTRVRSVRTLRDLYDYLVRIQQEQQTTDQ